HTHTQRTTHPSILFVRIVPFQFQGSYFLKPRPSCRDTVKLRFGKASSRKHWGSLAEESEEQERVGRQESSGVVTREVNQECTE
ncbi:hypothetical protein JMJ77_0002195, partial [Colletotrichum scovillei]